MSLIGGCPFRDSPSFCYGFALYHVPVIFPPDVPVGTNHPSAVRLRSTVCAELDPQLKITFEDVTVPGIVKTHQPLPSDVIAVPGHVFDVGDPVDAQ